MIRAKPLDQVTYQPMVLDEKDPIRHKYATLGQTITEVRDPTTGLLTGRDLVNRWDPQKPITWYFDPGFPDQYKDIFLGAGGIKERTNQIFSISGSPRGSISRNRPTASRRADVRV